MNNNNIPKPKYFQARKKSMEISKCQLCQELLTGKHNDIICLQNQIYLLQEENIKMRLLLRKVPKMINDVVDGIRQDLNDIFDNNEIQERK